MANYFLYSEGELILVVLGEELETPIRATFLVSDEEITKKVYFEYPTGAMKAFGYNTDDDFVLYSKLVSQIGDKYYHSIYHCQLL